jgi:hypothetical protein
MKRMKKRDVPALREALKEMIRDLKREKERLKTETVWLTKEEVKNYLKKKDEKSKPKIKYPLQRDARGRMMKGERI